MDIKQLVKDLDETILFADIVGAANRYFSDNVRIISGDMELTGKSDRIKTLENFLDTITALNQIQLHHQNVLGNDSFSLFTFDLTREDGNNLVWYEIIRRRWENGKVVEEEYFLEPSAAQIEKYFGQTQTAKKVRGTDEKKIEAFVASKQKAKPVAKSASKPASKPAAKPAPKPASKSVSKTAPKAASAKKAVEEPLVKERRKPGPKPNPNRVRVPSPKVPGRKPGRPAQKPKAPASELRKIKDLGPKVDNLLNMAGILTFSDLANAKKEVVISILQSAGPRFKEFDPAVWIKEAARLAKKK